MHRKGTGGQAQQITQAQLDSYRDRNPDNPSEAKGKFEKWRTRDPYPDIEPSLLNCADFCDYVVETGMVYPFRLSTDDVKLATYAFRVKGDIVWWDDDGDKKCHTISENQTFTLKGNSIAYVTLEPYLRMPDYIALRFNLKIKNVYRGLLLGTGPIVDPGYQGRLSIPLHNLTSRDYTFEGGERLIWVEFTKLSRHPKWDPDDYNHKLPSRTSSLYVPFPEPPEDDEWDVHWHLDKAVGTEGVRSSIPDAIDRAKDAAERARGEARSLSLKSWAVAIVSILGVFAGVAIGFYSVISVQRTYESEVRDLREQVQEQQRMIDRHEHASDTDSGQPD